MTAATERRDGRGAGTMLTDFGFPAFPRTIRATPRRQDGSVDATSF